MDLQISVFLLFILFTAGHSLNCYNCTGSGSCSQTVTCTSDNTSCFSSIFAGPADTSLATNKLCVPASNCTTGSINTGSYKFSTNCCNIDLCNSQNASDPSPPNGKQCYYCDGQKNCSKVLNCSGIQDRCIKGTGTLTNQTEVAKGCVSKSFCDAPASVGIGNVGIGNATCCEGNLCNGSQSVTQSFLFLCCSLLSFFLMH